MSEDHKESIEDIDDQDLDQAQGGGMFCTITGVVATDQLVSNTRVDVEPAEVVKAYSEKKSLNR